MSLRLSPEVSPGQDVSLLLFNQKAEPSIVISVYGFYDECKRRCSIKIWKQFVDVFNCLPIAATIGALPSLAQPVSNVLADGIPPRARTAGKIFCVHGGLSPSLSDLDNIRKIQRPTDVPDCTSPLLFTANGRN